MKIVCEACQAKYSIADEKVRGKVFKIRCKKCSHVIVVRGSGEVATTGAAANEFSAAPASSPDLALDAGWHIVVDGEQVGPLSEADVRARLSRSEITPETYIWREGLADWVKISTLAEFSGAEAGNPFPESSAGESGPFEADGPTAVAPPGAADPFRSPSPGGGVPAIAELFAAPLPGSDNAATTVSNSPGFGAFDPYSASEAAARGGGTNGNHASFGSAGGVGVVQPGLTGQRHENSVLFSLSNLEALAKPASASMPMSRSSAGPVSTSTTTEGSGLIDIRAMANMTLGGAARAESRGDDLPAFSAPQFSPVAPVLLPMGSSGTPRWAIVVFSVLGLAIVALGIVVVKMFTSPPAAPAVVQPAPAPPAPASTTPPAARTPPTSAQPPATPPPTANENLPPRETASPPAGATAAHHEGAPAERSGARSRPGGRRNAGGGRASGAAAQERPVAAAAPPRAAEVPRKPKDDIEALLEQASGRRNPPPARRDDDEPSGRGAAAPAAEKAAPLDREEIVKGMNAVMPKARDCYAQYKVPGVATVKITVSAAGRVTVATVTGRFAGTPSGSCVEAALKTARFPASAGRSFEYVVPLR